jgi:hypothetical protein
MADARVGLDTPDGPQVVDLADMGVEEVAAFAAMGMPAAEAELGRRLAGEVWRAAEGGPPS